MSHEDHMRRAIALSREKMNAGEGGPFAAVIVRDNCVIGEGWNQVTSSNDPTAHAEIVAIRHACATVGDFSLEGAVIYSSCEPCPMCLAAIYWARIAKLYYANSSHDAAGIDFDDEFLYHEIVRDEAYRSLPSERLLANEALAVFDEWRGKPDKILY